MVSMQLLQSARSAHVPNVSLDRFKGRKYGQCFAIILSALATVGSIKVKITGTSGQFFMFRNIQCSTPQLH